MSIVSTNSLQELEVLVSKLSGLTGLSREEISEQISTLQIPTFEYGDKTLVLPENLGEVIEAWASNIKTSLQRGESSGSSPLAANSDPEEVLDLSDTPTSAISALQWPKGYEKTVTHLYSQTLSRVLPKSPQEQRPYLEAIASKTEEGQRLVNELACAIVKRSKRKLSPDKVKDGLQAKIDEMYKAI